MSLVADVWRGAVVLKPISIAPDAAMAASVFIIFLEFSGVSDLVCECKLQKLFYWMFPSKPVFGSLSLAFCEMPFLFGGLVGPFLCVRFVQCLSVCSNLNCRAIFVTAACESDYSASPTSADIYFSADTLSFDTVFTGEPTPTAVLMIYNRSDADVTIPSISLRDASESYFRVSIDGQSSASVYDVRLRRGDSLYVFVSVNLPQSASASVSMVQDELLVGTSAGLRKATLIAYGQDVARKGGVIGSETWMPGVPYLLTSDVTVPEGETLTLLAGTTVFASEGASLIVEGSIAAFGSFNSPITFRGRRLEKFYDDVPAQWEGLSIGRSSVGNCLRHVVIANATYGLVADSAASVILDCLTLRDASKGGVLLYGADASLTNCLLYNCGGSLVAAYGGATTICHCTLSNRYAWDVRKQAALMLADVGDSPELLYFHVINSIITGNLSDELDLPSSYGEAEVSFNSCYLTVSSKSFDVESDARFSHCMVGTSPGFVSQANSDFRLDDGSPCLLAAEPVDGVITNFADEPRDTSHLVNVGAY